MLLPTSRATRTILSRNQRPTAKATPSNAAGSPGWRYPRGAVDEGDAPTRAATRIAHLVAPDWSAVDPWQGPSSGVRGRVSWLFIAIVYIDRPMRHAAGLAWHSDGRRPPQPGV